MKRFLSLFLGIVMLLGMVAGSLAFADEGNNGYLDSPITIAPTEDSTSFTVAEGNDATQNDSILGTEIDAVGVNVNKPSLTVDTNMQDPRNYPLESGEAVVVDVNSDVDGMVSVSSSLGARSSSSPSREATVDVTVHGDVNNNNSDFITGLDAVIASSEATASTTTQTEDIALTNSSDINIKVEGNVENTSSNKGATEANAVRAYTSETAQTHDNNTQNKSSATVEGSVTITVDEDAKATAITAENYSGSGNQSASATAVFASSGQYAQKDGFSVEDNAAVAVDVGGNAEAKAVASRTDDKATATAIIAKTGSDAFSGNATNDSTVTVTVGEDAIATATGENGKVLATAISASSDAKTYENHNGVAQNNSTVTVTVTGKAEATAEGKDAEAVGVNAQRTTTTVNYEENTSDTGNDNAQNNSTVTVTVKKDVVATAEGENSSATGVKAQDATVNVGGNVETTADKDATGIMASNGATVTVGGDVISSGDAIEVTVSTGEGAEKSTVVVEGTVSAGENALVLNVDDLSDTNDNVTAIIDSLPEIVVQTIAPDANIVVTQQNNTLSEASKDRISNAMLEQISYIVNTNNWDEASVSIVTYSLENEEKALDNKTIGGNQYLVAHEKQRLTVKNIGNGKILGITIGDGQTNQFSAFQDNGDGTWSIVVNRGGNLDFHLNYEAEQQQEEKKDEQKDEQKEEAKPEQQEEKKDDSNPEQKDNTTPEQSGKSETTIVVTPATGEVFTGPNLLTLGKGEESNVLIVNMVYTNKADILVATFRNFANKGYDTVQVRTAGGTYSITMAELLALAEGGSLITFVINGDLLEIYVDWQLDMTLALTRAA